MKRLIVLVLITLFSVATFGCYAPQAAAPAADEDASSLLFGLISDTSCKTKYPIVLVHGAFFRDKNMLGINYWWGIDSALRAKGATVYVTNQDPFNSEAVRAGQVANELGVQFALHPTWKKVNLIGHSMGPLDSRNVIANFNIPGKGAAKNYVASLTSISGTHTGSEVADLLYALQTGIPILGNIVGSVIENIIDLFGEVFELAPAQNTKALLYDLTSKTVKNVFNPNCPNQSGIMYQSYGGKVNYVNLAADLLGQTVAGICYAVMQAYGVGDNDCLVSIKSAKWGTWKGMMTTSLLYPGVNHFYEINHFLGISPGWDAKGFYVKVVKDLKAKGY
jgi:triacylglycerol lipase